MVAIENCYSPACVSSLFDYTPVFTIVVVIIMAALPSQPPIICHPHSPIFSLQFVRDYHVGISCDLETCALELRVLRDRSKVFLNAKAIVFDDGSNGSNGGGIVVVGADGEEKTLSPGVVPVRHGDCLCLMEASAIMFEVVHNQDLVNRLRLGEVNPRRRR
jgi:hypothetical protein